MADIFISYRSLRRPAIRHLTNALENHGFSVWFDYALLSGKAFAPMIERELRMAKAAVVVWCSLSRDSTWVREEASLAKELDIYLPVKLEPVDLPFGFRQDDTIDLSGWDGDPRGPGLDRLLEQVAIRVGRDPAPAFRPLQQQQMVWRDRNWPTWATMPLDRELAERLERERTSTPALTGLPAAAPPAPPPPTPLTVPSPPAPSPLPPKIETPAARNWARIAETTDQTVLHEFALTYPDQPEAELALARRRALSWAEARESASPAKWRTFIDAFANTPEAHEAQARLADRVYEEAIATGLPKMLEKAIADYPDHDRMFEARVMLRKTQPWLGARIDLGKDLAGRPIAFSPDGANLVPAGSRPAVTVTKTKIIAIRDTNTDKVVTTLPLHGRAIYSAAMSPDGTKVVTCSDDQSARIWDTTNGKLIATLKGHDRAVVLADFSPDGRKVATGSSDRTVRLWDTASGILLATLEGHRGEITAIAWSPQGGRIATVGYGTTAYIWDILSGQMLSQLEGHEAMVSLLAWSPDGSRLATTSDTTTRLWNSALGRIEAQLTDHASKIISVAWSPDGRRIVTADTGNTAIVWTER